jgi:omega-amidase
LNILLLIILDYYNVILLRNIIFINIMFKKFSIALCQMKVINDKKANLSKAKKMIEASIQKYKPNIVILPEYFNCPVGLGYTQKYAEEEKNSETLDFLSKIAKENKIYLVGGSIPIKDSASSSDDKYYNTSYCFDKNGEIKARHRKVHLFDIDIPNKITYQESATLSAGTNFTVFETEHAKIGIGICYDIRFGEYAQILKKYYNIDMLVYPAAFNTVTGPMHWELLHRSRALDNNVFLAICSPSRNYDDPKSYQSYGFSSIVDPFAKILATTGYEEDIVYSEIDLSLNKDIQEQIPTWKQKRNDMYELIKKI